MSTLFIVAGGLVVFVAISLLAAKIALDKVAPRDAA